MTIDNAVKIIEQMEDLPRLYDESLPKDFDAIGEKMEVWEKTFNDKIKPHLNNDNLKLFKTALATDKFAVALSLLQGGQKLTVTDKEGDSLFHYTFTCLKIFTTSIPDATKKKGLLAVVDQIVTLVGVNEKNFENSSNTKVNLIWSFLEVPNQKGITPIDLLGEVEDATRSEVIHSMQQKMTYFNELSNQLTDKINRAKKASQFQTVSDEKDQLQKTVNSSQRTIKELREEVSEFVQRESTLKENVNTLEQTVERVQAAKQALEVQQTVATPSQNPSESGDKGTIDLVSLSDQVKDLTDDKIALQKQVKSLQEQLKTAQTPPSMPGTLKAPIVPGTINFESLQDVTPNEFPPIGEPPPPKPLQHFMTFGDPLNRLEKHFSNICGGAFDKKEEKEHREGLRYAIHYGLNPNIRGGLRGNTGLHNAVAKLQLNIVKQLVWQGADTTLLNDDHHKPIACIPDNLSSKDAQKAADIRRILTHPLEHTKYYQLFVKLKKDNDREDFNKAMVFLTNLTSAHLLFECDSNKMTLLHHVAEACCFQVIVKILEKAELTTWDERLDFVNRPDKMEQTALHKALMRGTKDERLKLTLETLIENGADPRIESEGARPPLDIAKKQFPDPVLEKKEDDWEVQDHNDPGGEASRSGRSTKRESVKRAIRSLSRGRGTKKKEKSSRRGTSRERSEKKERSRKDSIVTSATDFSVIKILSDFSNQQVQDDTLKKYIGDLIYSDIEMDALKNAVPMLDMGTTYKEIWNQLVKWHDKYRLVYHVFNSHPMLESDRVTSIEMKEVEEDDAKMNEALISPLFGKNIDTRGMTDKEEEIANKKMAIYNKTRRLIQNIRECLTFLLNKRYQVSKDVRISAENRFIKLSKKLYFSYIRQSQGAEAIYLLKSKEFPLINPQVKDPSTDEIALFISMDYKPSENLFACPDLFMHYIQSVPNALQMKNSCGATVNDAIYEAENPLIRVQIAMVDESYKLEDEITKLDRHHNTIVHHCVMQSRPDLLKFAAPHIQRYQLWNKPNRAQKTPLKSMEDASKNPYVTAKEQKQRLAACEAIINKHIGATKD